MQDDTLLRRVGLAAGERRRELRLPRYLAARYAGRATTATRYEAGLPGDPDKILRYAGALMVLQAHLAPPLEASRTS